MAERQPVPYESTRVSSKDAAISSAVGGILVGEVPFMALGAEAGVRTAVVAGLAIGVKFAAEKTIWRIKDMIAAGFTTQGEVLRTADGSIIGEAVDRSILKGTVTLEPYTAQKRVTVPAADLRADWS